MPIGMITLQRDKTRLQYLWLFILLSLVAEILGTVGGFGSSVFFVPIANVFLDFQSVLGITALFHLSSNITKIYAFRKGIDWRVIARIGIPGIALVIVGAWASNWVPKMYLQWGLGIFLVIMSGLLLLFKQLELRPTLANSIGGGALSGLTAGLLGTGGAVRGVTLAAFNLEKSVFIATSAVIDLGIDLSRSVVYFFNGYIHRDDLYLVPILLVMSIVGTYVGKWVLDKFSQAQFKQIVLWMILAIGMVTIGTMIWGW
jgi:uncharacterized membrane protein YfcA